MRLGGFDTSPTIPACDAQALIIFYKKLMEPTAVGPPAEQMAVCTLLDLPSVIKVEYNLCG